MVSESTAFICLNNHILLAGFPSLVTFRTEWSLFWGVSRKALLGGSGHTQLALLGTGTFSSFHSGKDLRGQVMEIRPSPQQLRAT